MYPGACLILLVLGVVLLDDAEACGRPSSHDPENQCEIYCYSDCTYMCGNHCQRICKRSIPELEMADKNYQVVPMSGDFSHFDLNEDKLISPAEFANAQKVPLDEVYNVFQFADVNGDNMLDAEELATASFLFESEKISGENGNTQE